MVFTFTVSDFQEQTDILEAVLKAMQMTEEMGGSQSNFLQILNYGKDLYYKNSTNSVNSQKKWPSTWQSAIRMLEEHGYKGPVDLYVCLADCHSTTYGIVDSSTKSCSLCSKPAKDCISFSYLPLKDKIKRWCGNAEFCKKIVAHWDNKDHWLFTGHHTSTSARTKEEVWDGDRFQELAWFWDPSQEWTIPARCPLCKCVIGADKIEDTRVNFGYLSTQIELECPECYNTFLHVVRKAKGDPRNIGLIGHFDGWQPFSTSSKHSSGNIKMHFVNLAIHNYY